MIARFLGWNQLSRGLITVCKVYSQPMEEEAWEGSSHLLPDHDRVPSLLAHLEGAGDPGWLTRPQGLQQGALITGFHVAYMLVETRYGRVDRQVFVPNVQSCGVSDMAVAIKEGGETFSWFKYTKQVRFS